jgi:hypothetical protein
MEQLMEEAERSVLLVVAKFPRIEEYSVAYLARFVAQSRIADVGHIDHAGVAHRTFHVFRQGSSAGFTDVNALGPAQNVKVIFLQSVKPEPFARCATIDFDVLETDRLHTGFALGAIQFAASFTGIDFIRHSRKL